MYYLESGEIQSRGIDNSLERKWPVVGGCRFLWVYERPCFPLPTSQARDHLPVNFHVLRNTCGQLSFHLSPGLTAGGRC